MGRWQTLVPKKPKDEAPARVHRRVKLSAAMRAERQAKAFTRRVAARAAQVQAAHPGQEFPMNAWIESIQAKPIRQVHRVTGLPY